MRRNLLANPVIRWFLTGLNATLWAVAILMALLLAYVLSPAGTRSIAAAHQKMLDEIADENMAFCEEFGIPAGTEQHSRCLIELDRIRADERQRADDSAMGLL